MISAQCLCWLLQSVSDGDDSQLAHKLQELEQACQDREEGFTETSLNELMEPLLQDFWLIQAQKRQATKV